MSNKIKGVGVGDRKGPMNFDVSLEVVALSGESGLLLVVKPENRNSIL